MRVKKYTLFVFVLALIFLILLPLHINSVYNDYGYSSLFGGDSVTYYNGILEAGFEFNLDHIGSIFSLFGILLITDFVRSISGDYALLVLMINGVMIFYSFKNLPYPSKCSQI